MTSPDLRAVDELCRLAMSALRLGCRIQLRDVTPELQELLELAGVADILLGGESPDADPDGNTWRRDPP